MKHIKLFESHEEESNQAFRFVDEVNKAIEMDPVEGALYFQKLMGENFNKVPPSGFAFRAVRKYTDHVMGLDPQQKAEVKKALSANPSLTNLEDAENIINQKVKIAKEKYDEVMKNYANRKEDVPSTPEDVRRSDKVMKNLDNRKEDVPSTPEDVRRSDILDKFAAGEITKEEALASL